jgi:GTP pyrophosphokinase
MPNDFYQEIELSKKFDKKLVEKAFKFAQKAHAGQKRKSGEDYIAHPVEVAKILLRLVPDSNMVAAALLHDTVEDTRIKLVDIAAEFGSDVAMLVEGVTNLGVVDFDAYSTQEELEEAKANIKNQNLRELFLSMSKDVRVVIIKLADRLHNMRTIKALSKDDQTRIAKETLNIFAPLALRLGMGEIKGELEDLAFPIAYPDEYKFLKKEANRRYKQADRYVALVKRQISDKLKEDNVPTDIEGRAKHIYSLYKKITRPEINWDFDKIYDLVALRIVTDSIEDCYKILGAIHSIYRPLPNYIRDYIAAPKPNGYRSIHTSVFGPEARIFEIQIRTREMHEEAEYGVASHLHYTETKSAGASDEKLSKGTFAKNHQTEFLKQIKEWQSSVGTPEEFLEGLKIEFLDDRIYVFSPKGDIYDLPVGATPVDFAYEVHSRIGDSTKGAKVNGKIVTLDCLLKTRDVVEIIAGKTLSPNRSWLDFVKTSKARQHIRAFYRKSDFDKNKNEGEKIIQEELRVLNMEMADVTKAEVKSALSETSFKSLSDLYASVGEGITTPRQALKIIFGRSFLGPQTKKLREAVKITPEGSVKGMKIQVAPCCNPEQKDKIICYVTRGRGLTAHKKGCSNLKSLERDRLFEYNPWQKELLSGLAITAANRVGLLRDIANIISANNVNIEKITNRHIAKGQKSKIDVTISVNDLSELPFILREIASLPDVDEVIRVR